MLLLPHFPGQASFSGKCNDFSSEVKVQTRLRATSVAEEPLSHGVSGTIRPIFLFRSGTCAEPVRVPGTCSSGKEAARCSVTKEKRSRAAVPEKIIPTGDSCRRRTYAVRKLSRFMVGWGLRSVRFAGKTAGSGRNGRRRADVSGLRLSTPLGLLRYRTTKTTDEGEKGNVPPPGRMPLPGKR